VGALPSSPAATRRPVQSAVVVLLRATDGESRIEHRSVSTGALRGLLARAGRGDVQIEGNRVVWHVRPQGRTTVYQLILP
jgi:hypothetical protein